MSFQPITLELQNEERDLIRVFPFIMRNISAFRWYFRPVFALLCISLGALFTIYRLAIMTTHQYYLPDANHVLQLVTVKETIFHAVFPPMMFIVIGILYGIQVTRRVPAAIRRMTKLNPIILEPFTLTITENGIEEKTKGADSKLEWNYIKTCYEKLGGFILVFQGNNFIFIPARKISEENYLAVRKILSEKIGFSQG